MAESNDDLLGVEEIDALLKAAASPADVLPPSASAPPGPAAPAGLEEPRAFQLPSLEMHEQPDPAAGLDALGDVELDLRIELGRTELLIDDVLKLRPGAVVPLDKLAGDPVDILVNGKLIARGEVLVLNDNFCVRVAEILAPTRVVSGRER